MLLVNSVSIYVFCRLVTSVCIWLWCPSMRSHSPLVFTSPPQSLSLLIKWHPKEQYCPCKPCTSQWVCMPIEADSCLSHHDLGSQSHLLIETCPLSSRIWIPFPSSKSDLKILLHLIFCPWMYMCLCVCVCVYVLWQALLSIFSFFLWSLHSLNLHSLLCVWLSLVSDSRRHTHYLCLSSWLFPLLRGDYRSQFLNSSSSPLRSEHTCCLAHARQFIDRRNEWGNVTTRELL